MTKVRLIVKNQNMGRVYHRDKKDQSSKQYRSCRQTRLSCFPSVHSVLRTCPPKQMDLLLPCVKAKEKIGGEH